MIVHYYCINHFNCKFFLSSIEVFLSNLLFQLRDTYLNPNYLTDPFLVIFLLQLQNFLPFVPFLPTPIFLNFPEFYHSTNLISPLMLFTYFLLPYYWINLCLYSSLQRFLGKYFIKLDWYLIQWNLLSL